MGTGEARRAAVLPLLPLVALGCASTQKVSLECVPSEVRVYVDGRELEKHPDEIELRTDQPHTFYFKGGGYNPQMVVLVASEVEGEVKLTPDLCSEVVFAEMRPDVVVELEEEEPPP